MLFRSINVHPDEIELLETFKQKSTFNTHISFKLKKHTSPHREEDAISHRQKEVNIHQPISLFLMASSIITKDVIIVRTIIKPFLKPILFIFLILILVTPYGLCYETAWKT